ncbi:tetratricopeptide repeat protein [Breoghania sp. JC706]|uniref:tetratricopeptide repeat protein n=1 Tax=Breoghania sp. JC706 TaxID=3117732 RepID=UPI0030098880
MTSPETAARAAGGLAGLQGAALALLETLFARSLQPLGINGEAVFRRLAETGSIGGALGLDEAMLEALYARAYQYLRLGQVARAEEVFRTLCALDGTSPDHWLGFGICLRARENFAQALDAFDRAAERDPASAAPHFHTLEAFIRAGRWQEARAALERFDAAAPDAASAYLSEAVMPFRKALEIHFG